MKFWRRHAWWIGLLLLVAAGFSRLRFDAEILNLLPGDQPSVRGLKLYQQYFANARELLISLRAPDAERAEQLAGVIAARLRLETNLVAGVLWQPPWMEHPEQAAEIVACLWFNQPPETFGALTNRLAPENLPTLLNETREILATSLSPMDLARRSFDPYDLLTVPGLTNVGGFSAEQGQRAFGSADGTFRVLYVQSRTELGSYRECSSWLNAVQAAVADVRAQTGDWTGATVRYTGRPVFVSEIAASMQRDLTGSVTGTAVIIAFLFWLMHRRWLPMLWLLALLAMILAATIGLGSLLLGAICVVSLGFAAVLLGLAVDYAVVHYQEALSHPHLSVPEIRRAIAPSILWAAITTITAFLLLNLGGLPGLAQLGSLVGIGVALAALVMVMLYLPPLFRDRREPPPRYARPPWWTFFVPPKETFCESAAGATTNVSRVALVVTALVVVLSAVVLLAQRPSLDRTANALRPQSAGAETALEEITLSLGLPKDPLWVMISGADERAVRARLTEAETALRQAESNHVISDFVLPAALWPDPERQRANRATARALAACGPSLREAATRAGFSTNALFLTDELIRTWARAGETSGVLWPTNQMSRWILKQFVARSPDGWLAMGMVTPPTNHVALTGLAELSSHLAPEGILLSGWELLGASTLQRVQQRMWLVLAPMVVLVLASLCLAFRRATEVLLGLAVLLLSGLCLLAIMVLAGWSWNLLNLMALPLMLGTGVDYGIFMQLALRRHGGGVRAARRSIGRALLLCGGTAVAGFGSLAWSSNPGMASLGKVCAVGIGANMVIAVCLLPEWWARLTLSRNDAVEQGQTKGTKSSKQAGLEPLKTDSSAQPSVSPEHRPPNSPGKISAPSMFYQEWSWKLGLFTARILPVALFNGICLGVAEIYLRLNRARREVVVQNLLPALEGDRPAAERKACQVFREMALKIADLWRFESGARHQSWLNDQQDWPLFEAVEARGQGTLLITPHLGNWELGGPLLAHHGYKLVVLTQPEPGGLTELRKASRANWGIETLVVGNDAFAFVEIIKRLQGGETVALLIDRPPEPSAVMVELFGRPFPASIAAAELARASGCALVGVTILRTGGGYTAHVLPEIVYNRRELDSRESRRELTQRILRAFEPQIRQHLEQWYHFIPIWPEARSGESRSGPPGQ